MGNMGKWLSLAALAGLCAGITFLALKQEPAARPSLNASGEEMPPGTGGGQINKEETEQTGGKTGEEGGGKEEERSGKEDPGEDEQGKKEDRGKDAEEMEEIKQGLSCASDREALALFGLTLLRSETERTPKENVLLSPFSIEQTMGMAALGANGQTAEEMEGVLAGGRDFAAYSETLREAYETSSGAVLQEFDSEGKPVSVERNVFLTANSAWINRDAGEAGVLETYREAIREAFEAEIRELAFSDPGSKNEINGWVDEKTEGQIPSIVDSLDAGQLMVLINATLFEGGWTDRFAPEEDGLVFHSAEGKEEKTTALRTFGTDTYTTVAGRDAFIKYYNNDFYFLGILPKEGEGPEELLAELTPGELCSVSNNNAYVELFLTFPKYSHDWSGSMVPALKEAGMSACFKEEADFSRMAKKALLISDVIHKTHIEVDENGTKASAATAAVMLMSGAPVQPKEQVALIFDRPFVYFIMMKNSNMPVFMGVVNSME